MGVKGVVLGVVLGWYHDGTGGSTGGGARGCNIGDTRVVLGVNSNTR